MRVSSAWRGCCVAGVVLLACLSLSGGLKQSHAAPPEETPAPVAAPKPREPIYDEAANGKQQIEAALREAKFEHKRVLVKFGGNWCGWCYKLHDVFTQEENVRNVLNAEYVVVLVDVNNNRE
jgi:thioredoxin-related protein